MVDGNIAALNRYEQATGAQDARCEEARARVEYISQFAQSIFTAVNTALAAPTYCRFDADKLDIFREQVEEAVLELVLDKAASELFGFDVVASEALDYNIKG